MSADPQSTIIVAQNAEAAGVVARQLKIIPNTPRINHSRFPPLIHKKPHVGNAAIPKKGGNGRSRRLFRHSDGIPMVAESVHPSVISLSAASAFSFLKAKPLHCGVAGPAFGRQKNRRSAPAEPHCRGSRILPSRNNRHGSAAQSTHLIGLA